MIVVDTSVLWALHDKLDTLHTEARTWYDRMRDDLATTPLILAEVDYFALRSGPATLRAFYRDIGAGAYAVKWWPSAASEAAEIAGRYVGMGLGLADASLVALAARLETTSLATFDERHFRAVRPLSGGDAFTLLPRDAALA